MTRLRAALSWAGFLLWAAAVWALSSRSDPQADLHWTWEIPDKVEHGIEYAAGGFLAHAAFSSVAGAAAVARRSPALAALVTCAAWGAVDEIHQGFVPGRTTDPRDLVADVIGVAAGILVHTLWVRSVRRSR